MNHGGITLGIDPGTARLGYGVIKGGLSPQLIDAGVIETWPDEPMPNRLVTLYEGVQELITEFDPDVLAIEPSHTPDHEASIGVTAQADADAPVETQAPDFRKDRLPEPVNAARAHPPWSALNENYQPGPQRDRAVVELARLLSNAEQ